MALIAVPVVVAVIAIFTGADIGTGKWLSAAIFPDRRLGFGDARLVRLPPVAPAAPIVASARRSLTR